ncbi:MAG: spermine synthase, partial [Desulfobulbales bacterium]|nr:spermine synthase [Desulfobulbales bacterium]
MKKRFFTAILILGFSGLVAQILLLRELLIVFSGNELCIGIILANWLILEAFGSYVLGRRAEVSKYRLTAFVILTVLFSVSLLPAIYLTRILKGIMGISIGESIGFFPMLYTSFLVLLPVSMLHGALFTYSCRIYSMYSSSQAATAGRVYVYETAGTIIGGIVCTYFLIPYVSTFEAATGLALV